MEKQETKQKRNCEQITKMTNLYSSMSPRPLNDDNNNTNSAPCIHVTRARTLARDSDLRAIGANEIKRNPNTV